MPLPAASLPWEGSCPYPLSYDFGPTYGTAIIGLLAPMS